MLSHLNPKGPFSLDQCHLLKPAAHGFIIAHTAIASIVVDDLDLLPNQLGFLPSGYADFRFGLLQ